MSDQTARHSYYITTDTSFQNKRYGISAELEEQLAVLADSVQKAASPKMIDQLHQLIERYPAVPHLKNYLLVAFNALGNHEKSVKVTRWALKEHPDYLFARINMAHAFMAKEEFERVPALLGEDFELKNLYPDRDLFHLSEITAYLKTVVRYFAEIGNLELAEKQFSLLYEVAPDHHDTEHAETFLRVLRLKNASDRFKEEMKNRIAPVVNKVSMEISNRPAPQFNHPQIHNLYQYDLRIPPDLLNEIVALPRITLVEDLESVLDDALMRYGHYRAQEYADEARWFVLHAFFLLKEIHAEESLNKALAFLEGDAEFLNYWFGDHITATLWQCIYVMGHSNTTSLKQFLLKPGVDTYSKSLVSSVLCQLALHHPERRDEVLATYRTVFSHFAGASREDNIIDSDFLGLAICDAIDCKLAELKPVIEVLFKKHFVSMGICGSYEDVEIAFSEENRMDHKRDIQSILDLYREVLTTWAGYEESSSGEDFEDDLYLPQKPIIIEKTGRNDPCPCGSGKKYKKCCMDKE